MLDAEPTAQSPRRWRPSVLRQPWLRMSWAFVAGMLVLVVAGILSVNILMGLRAYGFGENVWTRFQKNAVIQLLRYSQTGDMQALRSHDEWMTQFNHLRRGRELIASQQPDLDRARANFSQADLPLNVIDAVLWLYRYLGQMRFFQEMLAMWGAAEHVILALSAQRELAVRAWAQGAPTPAQLRALAEAIHRIDAEAAPLQMAFTLKLNDTALVVRNLLVAMLAGLGAVLIGSALWRTRRLLVERERAEAALAAERQRAAVTLASIGDAVVATDAAGRVIYMNGAAQRLTQMRAAGPATDPSAATPAPAAAAAPAVGPPSSMPAELPVAELAADIRIVNADSGEPVQPLSPQLLAGEVDHQLGDADQRLVRPDGSSVPVSWVVSPIRVGDDEPQGAVLVLHDTTREQRLIERLGWLASHDPLTHLPNRRAFESGLQHAIDTLAQRSARTGVDGTARAADAPHAVMFIDLDQFKIVNDTCGHAAGDELLRLVSAALKQHLREGDLLARMGGDEFGVLLVDCPVEVSLAKAEEMRRSVGVVVLKWGLRSFTISASIGLVRLESPAHSLGEVLSAADVACYAAKDAGRNRVVVYRSDDAGMVSRVGEMAWAQRLQVALRDNRFCLYRQAVVPLQPSGQGQRRYELLLRLRNDDDQLVPPGLFIPAAERFGMMGLVDRWVVDHALAHIAQTIARGDADADATYAINLSGSSFGEPQFLADLRALFVQHGVPHRLVCFEITETQVVANLTQAMGFIEEMRALGCSFALDDFGAGMSSFGYLKHLRVDLLKIDGTLVKDMVNDEMDRVMVETIHRMGHAMHLRTVGEYAETPAIVEALRGIGVDYAQGYAYGKPEPFE